MRTADNHVRHLLADEVEGSLRHNLAQTNDTLNRINHVLAQLPDEPLYRALSGLLAPLYQHVAAARSRMPRLITALRNKADER